MILKISRLWQLSAWQTLKSITARPIDSDMKPRRTTISRRSLPVIGQPFRYEARPPEEFYRNVLAAGAEPSYMKCVFDSYTELTNGTAVKPDEIFDNLPTIIGRQPRTLADFAKKHADKFRY